MLEHVIFGPDEDSGNIRHRARCLPLFACSAKCCILEIVDAISDQIRRMLWEERAKERIPYKPFSKKPDFVDPAFKVLIQNLAIWTQPIELQHARH
jgi:hypothetical protein